jgi:hypothetical protein
MDRLFNLDGPFGLRWEELEYLRMHSCLPKPAYFVPVYSIPEAVYLAAGASFKAGRLVAIRFPAKDKITAWPLWNVEQGCAFVLGFRFDSDWRPVAFVAEEVSFLRSVCSFAHLSRTDRAWDWAGYAGLAVDTGWLESGTLILNGRFRTSYSFAGTLLEEFGQTRQQKPNQKQCQEQPGHPNEDFLRRRGLSGFSNC